MPVSIVILLLSIWCTVLVQGKGQLVIDRAPKFPHSIDTPFEMGIKVLYQNESMSTSALDSLILRITNPAGVVLENEIFDYGFKSVIDEAFNGEYVRISEWRVFRDQDVVNISIWFTERANNKSLEIYQLSASSFAMRRKMLSNLKLTNLIYKEEIKLFFPTQLELSVRDFASGLAEVRDGRTAVVTCKINNGKSNEIPILKNLKNLSVISNSLSIKKKEITAVILVSSSDHKKVINCSAGSINDSIILNVLHRPTQVRIEPDIKTIFENDSNATCLHKDGFPIPKTQWFFIEGPSNAKRFYNISKNGKILHMKVKVISKQRWKFSCHAMDSISKESFEKTISFVVTKRLVEKNIDVNRSNSFNETKDMNLLVTQVKYLHRKNEEYDTQIQKCLDRCTNVTKLVTQMKKDNSKEIFSLKEIYEKQIKTLNELFEEKIKHMENNQLKPINFEFIWKIDDFSKKRNDVLNNEYQFVYSDTFYTHKNGYKMRLLLYPEGHSYGAETHLSVYFQILKGKFDAILPWPMKHEITIALVSQKTGMDHQMFKFRFDKVTIDKQNVFGRPKSEENSIYGADRFVALNEIVSKLSLSQNDEIYLRCTIFANR